MSSKITSFSTQPHLFTPAQITQEHDYCYEAAKYQAQLANKTVLELLSTQGQTPELKLQITTNFAIFTKQMVGQCLEEIADIASRIGLALSATSIELPQHLAWDANDPIRLLVQIKPFALSINNQIAALKGNPQEKAKASYLLLKQLYSVLEDACRLTENSASSNQQQKVERVFSSVQSPHSSTFPYSLSSTLNQAVDHSLDDASEASVLRFPSQSPSALPGSTPLMSEDPSEMVKSSFNLLRGVLKNQNKEKSDALVTMLNSFQQQFEGALFDGTNTAISVSHLPPPLPPAPDLFHQRKRRVLEIMGQIESAIGSKHLSADERLVTILQEIRTLQEKVAHWMKGMHKNSLVEMPDYFEDRENSPENINEWFNNFKKHVQELLDAKPNFTYTHLFVLQSDINEFLDLPDITKVTQKLVFNNGKLPSKF